MHTDTKRKKPTRIRILHLMPSKRMLKLLITLAAFVFGFDGDFDFKDIAK